MYANSSKFHAAAQRALERRKSEDDAPRLAAEVPTLRSARILIIEQVPTGSTRHTKHVVVARAPALFVIPCGDSTCQDGGHDITSAVMSAFRRKLLKSEGEDGCGGMSGSAPCGRSIRFELSAEYAPAP
jgi:hypothetical protein